MKQKLYIFLACLVSAGAMLTSCQDVHSPYNAVPVLDQVTVSTTKQDLSMMLSHYMVDNDYYTNSYFLVSQSADMSNPELVNASSYSSMWTATVDLAPDTTYFAQFCMERTHGKVSGPVTVITTPALKQVTVSSITASGAYLYFPWTRSDYQAVFLVSTKEDMSNAVQYPVNKYSGYSYYATEISKLESNTTYYAAIRLTKSGVVYTTKPTSFTTLTSSYVEISSSKMAGYGGLFVVGPNGTMASNLSGYSWSGTITGETNVYAYKPYQKGNFTYENVPIYYTMDGFEYGHATVNPNNSKANCEMKALQPYQVIFNVLPQSTNGAQSSKYINSMSIGNTEKSYAISTNATFNLSTSVLTPTKNNAATWPQSTKIALSDTKSTSVSFQSIIPTKFSEGEVKVNIVLNNSTSLVTEVVPVTLPATSWEGGKTYNYDIIVRYTRTDVEVVISDLYVTPWSNGGNTNIDIYD